jgi:lambda family phage portal protein
VLEKARSRLAQWLAPRAAYEIIKPSRLRKSPGPNYGPLAVSQLGQRRILQHARQLERDSDLFRGALGTLVDNVVGAGGLGLEPTPRDANGDINEEFAKAIRALWADWSRRPDVTWELTWSQVQRLAARAWFRDGEMFAQMLSGPVQYLDHGTKVPFSLELFEADYVPLEYSDGNRINQGIERNAWGRPIKYYAYRNNPLDASGRGFGTDIVMPSSFNDLSQLKTLPADRVLHLLHRDRIGQIRGVSHFASVIARLADLNEYETAERIAAKIAASVTGVVTRGEPGMYNPADSNGQGGLRDMSFAPGMMIDSLLPGERLEMLDPSRPNPNAVGWREGQLKAFAAGSGSSFSTIARSYNGTFSAQRQELVESYLRFAVMADDFSSMFVGPVYRQFIATALASGLLRVPKGVDPSTIDQAMFVGQSMPWVDPVKEAEGWLSLVRAGFASEEEAIRARGQNPDDVLAQIKRFRDKAAEAGAVLESDAKYSLTPNEADPAPVAPAAPAPGKTKAELRII